MKLTRTHRTRNRLALAVGLVATLATAGIATAAPALAADVSHAADTYQLSSSPITIGPWDAAHDIHGMCGSGYHVLSQFDNVKGIWFPVLQVKGTDIYLTMSYSSDDTNGNQVYQGFHAGLKNSSWTSTHTGTVTWTCVSN